MLLYWYEIASVDFSFTDTVGILSVGSCEQHGEYLHGR